MTLMASGLGALLVFYILGAGVSLIFGIVFLISGDDLGRREHLRWGARALLFCPVWPLLAVWGLVKGIIILVRLAFGKD